MEDLCLSGGGSIGQANYHEAPKLVLDKLCSGICNSHKKSTEVEVVTNTFLSKSMLLSSIWDMLLCLP